MTAARDDEEPSGAADRCPECGGRLGHDQRYCLHCGSRRGRLPTRIAVALTAMAERGRGDGGGAGPEPAEDDAAPESGPPPDGEDDAERDLIPLARAAAVSILLMMGVGSVIGSLTTPGGVETLASTIVLATNPARIASTPLLGLGPGRAGNGGSTPVASAGRTGGGTGRATGGGTTAPQLTRTVTVSASSPTPGSTGTTPAPSSGPIPAGDGLPAIHHVWEIVLSDQGYEQSFGTTAGHPYLSRTLARQGTVLADDDAVAGSPLANEIALVSGQGPTPQTLADCPTYEPIAPGRTGAHDQILGTGCVYPSSAPTLGTELAVQGETWRAFIQGVGGSPSTTSTASGSGTATDPTGTTGTTTGTPTGTTSTTTGTPADPTGTTGTPTEPAGTATAPSSGATTATSPTTTAPPPTATAAPTTSGSTTTSSPSSSTTPTTTTPGTSPPLGDTESAHGCPHPATGASDPGPDSTASPYATWTNPWVYFGAVLDSTTCARDDVGLDRLAASLRRANTTPNFSYIAPDPCDDGSDTPCAPGARAGLGPADGFLRTVVPLIERSPAYRAGGLILITFDEAPQSGPDWSTASCCGQPTFPNLRGLATSTSSGTTTAPTTPTTPTTPGATTSTPTTPGTGGTPTTPTGTTTTPTTPGTTTPTSPGTSTTTGTMTTGATTTGTTGPVITGTPPGGGQVGLLMISPWVAPDGVDAVHILNHLSVLKTVSTLLGVRPPGYADDADVPAISPALFLAARRR